MFSPAIAFVAAAELVVLAHVLGHYLAARRLHLKIDRISIGIGPALRTFRARNVDWSISWFPIGGYIKVAPQPSERAAPQVYLALAGPGMNILFAFFAFFIVFVSAGIPLSDGGQVALQPLSIAQALAAVGSALILTWIDWSSDAFYSLAGYYGRKNVAAGIALLAALWSSKLAFINLIPFPGTDGWAVTRSLVQAHTRPDQSERILGLLRWTLFSLMAAFLIWIWTPYIIQP